MAKVLIVDDERSIRRTLGAFLRDAGHVAVEAEDADTALAGLKDTAFDVVVSDIVLPRLSGVELLRQIHLNAPNVQVVMMTGEPTAETAAEALRLGAADYLFKPITKDAILRAVASAARIKELEDARRRLEAENAAHRANLESQVAERTAQLRASERRFRSLVETAFDWVWEVDANCRYTYASPRVRDLLGYEPEEVVGRTPFDLMPEAEAIRVRQLFDAFAAERKPFAMLENTNRHRDGRLVVVESSAHPILSPSGELQGYHGTDRDVTARIRAAEQMRQLARAVEQSPASIMITDREGLIEFVNRKFTQVTGYSLDEVRGRNPRLLKSGETPPDEYRRLWLALGAGDEWSGEFRNRKKDGSFYWESLSISPLRDQAGRITHFLSVGEDVTDKKLLQERLLRSQRVESIGSLASGIAHDLNNILSPILMCAGLVRTESDPAARLELADMIDTSARRAVDIVKQLLGFARGQEGRKQPVQVRHLIRDMGKIARETFPRTIRIHEICPSDLWLVVANPTQLHQVLLNLCVNARDAMPQGGSLTLRAANVTLNEHFAALPKGAPVGPYLRLEVEDTGIGIPEDVRGRIFESFFTTKEEGQGTGLGLTTVLGIVKEHGGFIALRSEVGHGTAFEVYLPATPEAAAVDDDESVRIRTPRGRGERVLVVDDEAIICEATRRSLERHGYRTLPAIDGIDALAQLTKHAGEIHAVVTDFMMPLMDGMTLCRSIRAISPKTPVIVSSGGLFGKSGERTIQLLRELGVRHILTKPHTADRLFQALASELQGWTPVERSSAYPSPDDGQP